MSTRQGTGSSYLIVDALQAASGAEPGEFGRTLNSDVHHRRRRRADDLQRPRPGHAHARDERRADREPTANNFITINRYRVRFIRADGRNTPGVDVPYGFDGAVHRQPSADGPLIGFELVRHIAKTGSPAQGAGAQRRVIISTIAEITFYGHDQTGREVSVTGQMLVSFGNFGDPD